MKELPNNLEVRPLIQEAVSRTLLTIDPATEKQFKVHCQRRPRPTKKSEIPRVASGAVTDEVDTKGIFDKTLGQRQRTKRAILAREVSFEIKKLPINVQRILAVATWAKRERLCKSKGIPVFELVASVPEFTPANPSPVTTRLITEQEQAKFAKEVGLWPDNKHIFKVSPTPIELRQNHIEQINEIGAALFGDQGVLNGLLNTTRELITKLPNHPMSSNLKSAISTKERQVSLIGRQPTSLVRLDLMVDINDSIQIAEIEGAGKIHGLGFGLFTEKICTQKPSHVLGTIEWISQVIKTQDCQPPVILVATSPFFAPEIAFLVQQLNLSGIQTSFVIKDPKDNLASPLLPDGTLFNLPPNSPSTWQKAWAEGKIQAIIPPRPILEIKTILALLSNPNGDPDIESTLLHHITADKLSTIRQHLPFTRFLANTENAKPEEFIFKTAKGSGAKGISHAPQIDTEVAMQKITQKHFSCQFARLAAFMAPHGLVTMPITLNKSEIVHGGPESTQTSFTVSL